MLFYDDTMLDIFKEENPGATTLEIISFLKGIKAMMTNINEVMKENHIMIVAKTEAEIIEDKVSEKTNIIEFPQGDG